MTLLLYLVHVNANMKMYISKYYQQAYNLLLHKLPSSFAFASVSYLFIPFH
jgi:hypothetical protein